MSSKTSADSFQERSIQTALGITFDQIGFLVLTASVVALLARKVHLPYTVGLVLTGIVLAAVPMAAPAPLTKHLIFFVFLPPLVFEAAFSIPWHELRRDLPVILTLATVGVLLSAGLTAAGMHYAAHWQWTTALLFGVLIAATDPVSVIATFKAAGVEGRLRVLVEAESLFNDGTAAVAFGIALTVVQGGFLSGSGIALSFVVTVFGGIVCGLVVAGTALLLAGHTDDHLLEIALTTVAAYGSFLLAEHFHLSGVLASLSAGLLIGNAGSLGSFTDKGREAVGTVWEYIAFLANSLIFLLIGLRLTHENFAEVWVPAIIAVVLVVLGRALAVYPCCALFARSAQRVPWGHQHILVWGGLRGALALALALGLPPELPQRQEITTAAFAVVTFSIVVQGVTMKPLLKKVGALGS